MREHIIKLYSFDELSEAAQQNAYQKYGYMYEDDFDYNYKQSLDWFCKTFGVLLNNYNVGYPGNSYKYEFFDPTFNGDQIENNPIRMAKFMYNNFGHMFTETRKKYYKINKQTTFVIDGYEYQRIKPLPVRVVEYEHFLTRDEINAHTYEFSDIPLLLPVYDCITYKRLFGSYRELIDACFDEFFEAWNADIEYTYSFEYFDEMMCNNCYEFLETGEMWK